MGLLDKVKTTIGVRHLQMFYLFITGMIFYSMAGCLSVAVVAMTDKSNTTRNRYIETFDWDSKTINLILSSQSWGPVLAQIPFGFAITKYSAQKILNGCVLVCGLVHILIPLTATNMGWIGVVGCIATTSVTLASIDLCQLSLLSRWAPPNERARLSGFVFSGGSTGSVLAHIFSGLLGGSKYGWPSIFYVFGGIGTVWSIVYHVVGANSPAEHKTISLEERRYIETSLNTSLENVENKSLKFPWKSVLKSLPVWAFTICVCGDLWNFYMTSTQFPMFMNKILNFDIEKSGGLSALPFLAKISLSVSIGWLSDFALKRGVSTSVLRKVANTIGMWGSAAALMSLCLFDPRSNETVTVVVFILAIGLPAANYTGYLINAVDLTENFSGTLLSIASTMGTCLGIFAPIVVGFVVTDQTDLSQWRVVFYVTAGILFVPNLIFIIFGKAEKQPWNEPNHSMKRDVAEEHHDDIEIRDHLMTISTIDVVPVVK